MKITLAQFLMYILGGSLFVLLMTTLLKQDASILFTCISWITFLLISILLPMFFNKINTSIRILIGIGTFALLATTYIICIQYFADAIQYINTIMVIVFFGSLFIFYISIKSNNTEVVKSTPEPNVSSNPIGLIIKGRIKTAKQLHTFYDNLEKPRFTYLTFLSAIYDATLRNTEITEGDWEKVESLVFPILQIEKDKERYDKITSKEKEFVQNIHTIVEKSDINDKERLIDNIKSLADAIIENEERLAIEHKRNNQSLTLSWGGIILTLILSIISIYITINGITI